LIVDFVDSTPQSTGVGTVVVTKFHVIYPDGTPVTLSPEIASFRWLGRSGEKILENVPVVPTGEPGCYTYTETVTDEFPTGTVVVSVIFCCLSDIMGNYGPTDESSSDTTLAPNDDSVIEIGPPTPKPPTVEQLFITYGVPIAIVVLIAIALILLAARARKRKT
jgi:hypothetical protein